MTKSKKSNNANGMNALLPLGSQAVTKVAPKQTRLNTVTKHAFQARGFNVELSAGSSGQTYGPTGTKFADLSLGFTLAEFFTPAEITRWDMYRMDEIEVFAYSLVADNNVRFHTIVDLDDTNVIPWSEMRKRSNTSMAVLRTNNPMQVVAKFKPVPEFTPVAGGDPSNRVGKPMQWIDCRAETQPFVGVKFHLEGETLLTPGTVDPKVGFLARAKITFKGQV